MSTEVVLPDGRFALIRTITVADVVATQHANFMMHVAGMAAAVTTIDGLSITLQDILRMDWADYLPISNELNKQFAAADRTKNGVA